jgi:transposase
MIATLEGTIVSLRSEVAAQRAAFEDQKVVFEKTAEALQALQRRFLGPKPERMPTPTEEIKKKRGEKADPAETRAKRRERADKRAQVETRVVPHRVPDAQRTCPHCGSTHLKPVGDGRSTPLWQYVPGHFIREEHVQETLTCPRGCDYIVTAPGPIKPFENGRYGASFVAYLIVAKCLDAIPHHRLEKMFQRLGIPMSRSTMTDLFHRAAESLAPLVNRLFALIAAAPVVLADETSIKIQDREKRGFIWTFSTPEVVGFRFSTNRSGETPKAVLGGTQGILLVDAYTGYNEVTDVDGRIRAACLAHARRKIFESKESIPTSMTALEIIRDVYEVERDALELGIVGSDAHLALRRERSTPLMARLRTWLDEQDGLHPPKSKPGKAIRYALKNWAALTVFLGNAHVPVGRVGRWRGGCRSRGVAVADGFRKIRRCLNPRLGSVSSARSSNRACGFPAHGSPSWLTPSPSPG